MAEAARHALSRAHGAREHGSTGAREHGSTEHGSTGRGAEHTIPWTLFGDWKKPGEKSSVKSGFSSFLRSVKVETKK
ncbi:hypothetical protein ACFW80_30595 [Streptomyces fimicarius]|uniref:hypothetical protein n=1 Tax=Streptomyces griseus TaxID=1911 RepID=UPI0036B36A5C